MQPACTRIAESTRVSCESPLCVKLGLLNMHAARIGFVKIVLIEISLATFGTFCYWIPNNKTKVPFVRHRGLKSQRDRERRKVLY